MTKHIASFVVVLTLVTSPSFAQDRPSIRFTLEQRFTTVDQISNVWTTSKPTAAMLVADIKLGRWTVVGETEVRSHFSIPTQIGRGLSSQDSGYDFTGRQRDMTILADRRVYEWSKNNASLAVGITGGFSRFGLESAAKMPMRTTKRAVNYSGTAIGGSLKMQFKRLFFENRYLFYPGMRRADNIGGRSYETTGHGDSLEARGDFRLFGPVAATATYRMRTTSAVDGFWTAIGVPTDEYGSWSSFGFGATASFNWPKR